MIWVTHAGNVVVAVLEEVLGPVGAHGHGLGHLLVDHDEDLDALLGLANKQTVQTPLWEFGARAAKEELWGQPPVGNVDALLGAVEDRRQRIEVVVAVDVPVQTILGEAPSR